MYVFLIVVIVVVLRFSVNLERSSFIFTYAYVFDGLNVLESQSLCSADECVFVKVKQKLKISHLFEPYRIVDYVCAQTIPC